LQNQVHQLRERLEKLLGEKKNDKPVLVKKWLFELKYNKDIVFDS
jgi:hypothetical protein